MASDAPVQDAKVSPEQRKQAKSVIITPLTLRDSATIQSEVQRLLEYACEISFDIETTGFDPLQEELVLLTFKAPGARTLMIDARDSRKEDLAPLIAPLFDEGVVLWGHNLQFDMYWMKAHLGINSRAALSDTMLRELLLLGIGFSDGNVHVDLQTTAQRYGVVISKTERQWFPGVNKRLELRDKDGSVIDVCTIEEDQERIKELKIRHFTEVPGFETAADETALLLAGWSTPWLEAIPQVEIEYARRDVASVIRIHKAQDAGLREQRLEYVADLESRVLPAVITMKAYGVGVDRAVFGEVIESVRTKSEELAVALHEALDVSILSVRETAWKEQMAPHQGWLKLRKRYMETIEEAWESEATEVYTMKNGGTKRRVRKDYNGKSWGVFKKAALASFKERYPEPVHPPALKAGVNLNSPAQIVAGLNGMGLLVTSADQKVLTPFSDNSPIGNVVQMYLSYSDYKTVEKRWGGNWMQKHLVPDGEGGWRWHVDWQQIGAGTGRFSSSFQQVNKRGPGAGLRRAFVPRAGYKLIVADFSNVELRIAAALSGDTFLLSAFASGEDLHTSTAELMFQLQGNADYILAKAEGRAKEWADTTDAVVGGRTLLNVHYRDIAKTINFAVLYGAGVRNLAAQLRVDEAVARQLKQLHYDAFHVALDWITEQGKRATGWEARNKGKVCSTTRSGRRRWFILPVMAVTKESSAEEVREEQDKYKGKLAEIRRSLANAPVQGTSADITKLAMALWHEQYECERMHLVFTVHDELAIECFDASEALDKAQDGLRWCMLQAMQRFIPEVAAGAIEPVVSDFWRH